MKKALFTLLIVVVVGAIPAVGFGSQVWTYPPGLGGWAGPGR